MKAIDPASLPLRDIYLPNSVSWWPPALGWWLLLLVIICVMTLLLLFIRKRNSRRYSVICLAKKEIRRIEKKFKHNQNKKLLARELSELLRRISISIFPRQDTASLTGDAWLTFLDERINKNLFSKNTGRVLIDAPYQEYTEYDGERLLVLVASWIDIIAKQKKGRNDSL